MGLYFGNNKITGVRFGTVSAGGTAITLSTPTLSLNSNTGVVTATITQSQSGYLTAGSASNILSLTTQAATTITPTESTQTAVAAGKYTLGAVTVAAIPSSYIIPSGTLNITTNGTHTVTNYASVSVNVPTQGGSSITLGTATRTYTPTESSQTETITPSSGFDGLSQVSITIDAISSTYVGSGITRRSSTDLSASGATVTVPAGYYVSQVTKSVAAMTLPTAASSSSSGTSKATITPSTSNKYINIPTGYNSAASYYTISGDADLVAANIKSGITIFGVEGQYSGTEISLQARTGINPSTSSQTITADAGYDGLSSVQINAMPAMTLPTSAASTASGARKATISRSTSTQYINIPTGYNDAAAYYQIDAVANGSATGPSSLSGSSATISTGTNTITLTKTGVTTTPTVSAGYVSSATASTATVSLTASVTTKSAATITPGTSNQTIAAGTYLTGIQTIAGDADLVAANIKSGVQIFGVTGTYEGSGSGGTSKNAQSAQSTTRSTSSSYTEVISLTCSKAGTYDVYWSTFRSSTSGTWGSQLYLGSTAYGTAQTGSWSNHIQNIYLTNVQIAANQKVSVRVRSRGSNYYGYVGTLTIIEQ